MLMNHLRKSHLCALGYGCMVTVEGGALGCPEHEAMLSAEEAVAMAFAWTGPDAVLEATATMVVRRLLEATKPPACEACGEPTRDGNAFCDDEPADDLVSVDGSEGE